MSSTAPRVLVFADSLAFYGPDGPLPADDPRLWPTIAAARLGGTLESFAGVGWTAREAYFSLAGDPRVWPLLPDIDALVLAVGSMDTLPSPLPSYLRQGIRYLRPDGLRRAVRRGYLGAQPVLSRALRGWPRALPSGLSVSYLDKTLCGIRTLRPGLPCVAVLPAVHRARSYGLIHTGKLPARRAITAWARRRSVTLVDLEAITGEHVLSGAGNDDGMHWGWAGHRAAGAGFAAALRAA
ncbi:MAG: diglucosylglycerate octanoyltransferase, partial [Sciscionella sp.]